MKNVLIKEKDESQQNRCIVITGKDGTKTYKLNGIFTQFNDKSRTRSTAYYSEEEYKVHLDELKNRKPGIETNEHNG